MVNTTPQGWVLDPYGGQDGGNPVFKDANGNRVGYGTGNSDNRQFFDQSGNPVQGTQVQVNNQPTLGFNQSTNQTGANMASTGNPYLDAAQQTTAGNMQQARAATAANRINQSTPYANLNYQQTGTDAQGNPIWSANQTLAAPLQSALGNIQQNVANTTQNAFNANPYQAQTGQGFTGMEGWDKATSLINQRLQPQMAQAAESNTAALANQGIVPGTQAYENAMRTFNQGQNDLLTQAQLAGSQVQNTMQGQSLAQQQANNAAQGQNFSQNYNAYNNPLQQLGAFQSGTQPGYVNPYSQATVAGPDYLGAYSTQNAQAIAAQNAANARTANTQSGLYGLGSAALLGGGGLGGLLGTAGTATTAGSGLIGLGGALTGAGTGISNWWNNLGSSNPISYDASGAVINSPISYGDAGSYTTSAGNFINPSQYSLY